MYTIHEEIYKGLTIRLEPDEFAENPRHEGDNLGTFVCWHRRMQLGDDNPSCHPYEYFNDKFNLRISEDFHPWDVDEHSGLLKKVVILPVYMYSHGGDTISTSPFSCPWDSGQIGFIYASMTHARKWTGRKNVTRDEVRQYLESEVKVLDAYMNGRVVCWEVVAVERDEEGTPLGDEEVVDSVCGYYPDVSVCGGTEKEYEYALSEARSAADRYLEKKPQRELAAFDAAV